MKRSENMFVVGIVVVLLVFLYTMYSVKDTPSRLSERITQGINCAKYNKDCRKYKQ